MTKVKTNLLRYCVTDKVKDVGVYFEDVVSPYTQRNLLRGQYITLHGIKRTDESEHPHSPKDTLLSVSLLPSLPCH